LTAVAGFAAPAGEMRTLRAQMSLSRCAPGSPRPLAFAVALETASRCSAPAAGLTLLYAFPRGAFGDIVSHYAGAANGRADEAPTPDRLAPRRRADASPKGPPAPACAHRARPL